MKMRYKKRYFFFIFDIYYTVWKTVKYIMSLIKIWAH